MNSILKLSNITNNKLIQLRYVHYLRSQLLVPSTTHDAANRSKTKSVSCLILENNGFMSDTGTGTITYLPVGKRVINKLTHLIRNEMNKIQGQEIEMPSLSDLSLWSLTGRDELIGTELFKLTDRKDKKLCLCPTHEEIVTSLVSKLSKSIPIGCLNSSTSLKLYQITRKYRDESRPKHGLLRGKEFLMKDMYTFHLNDESVQKTYDQVCKAYETIFEQLDLKYLKAKASVGSMGGQQSHEYHIESEIGEDKIFTCTKCNKSISIDLVQNNTIQQNDLCKLLDCSTTTNNDENVQQQQQQQHKKSIEIGHTFILGERYTKLFPIQTLNQQDSSSASIKMGCFGIGVSRLMQSCIEVSYSFSKNNAFPDWPLHIAPFQLAILPAKDGSKQEHKSKQLVPYLCDMLSGRDTDNLNMGVLFKDDILVDDRTWMSIGSRLIDAKLLGIPFLIVLGKQIDDENIEIVINSARIAKILNKDKVLCHSRETAHVLKQLINDYFYTKKQAKIANYFS